MSEDMNPRYPIYIPSRGRSETTPTATALLNEGIEFHICVAPFEADQYRQKFGDSVLVLPSDDMGIADVRNWMRRHSEETYGAARHWQLDDNIKGFVRRYKARRIPCSARVALRMCEVFTDRYTNIAISGLGYTFFRPDNVYHPPFNTNVGVYSCILVNNAIPYEWRGPYNDDTDMCLQVLSGGWCTVLLNAFLQEKMPTMSMKGGMTDSSVGNYQGDGKLKRARGLEARWPGVVTVERRFKQPQHYVVKNWSTFTTPLQLREGIDLQTLSEQGRDEHGIKLREVKPVTGRTTRAIKSDFDSKE